MNEKEFSEYWAKVEKLHALSEMAIKQLPYSLSPMVEEKADETKTRGNSQNIGSCNRTGQPRNSGKH